MAVIRSVIRGVGAYLPKRIVTNAELSRLVEYAFDDAGYQEVWSYESDKFENVLGDVRRIPIDGCDNLLVSWSGQGRISEITRDGELVITSRQDGVIQMLVPDSSRAATPSTSRCC